MEISRRLRREVPVEDIEAILETLDGEAIRSRHTFSWEVWDKQSPINGVPAQSFLERPDFSETGLVYIVRIDGQPSIIQPHPARLPGFIEMTEETVADYAEAHLQDISYNYYRSEVKREVMSRV